jgi:hypothetical protein
VGCRFLVNVYKGLTRLQPYNLDTKKKRLLFD